VREVLKLTKTIIPFALVGYEVIITNSRYALIGYFITSYLTRAHGIINCFIFREEVTSALAGFHGGPPSWSNWNLEC